MGLSKSIVSKFTANIIELKGIGLETTSDGRKLCTYSIYTMGENILQHVKKVGKTFKQHGSNIQSIYIEKVLHQFLMMITRSNDKRIKSLFPTLHIRPCNMPWILLALVTKTNVDSNTTI